LHAERSNCFECPRFAPPRRQTVDAVQADARSSAVSSATGHQRNRALGFRSGPPARCMFPRQARPGRSESTRIQP
jgi:hypothetical protein